jgi:hypothetical protein
VIVAIKSYLAIYGDSVLSLLKHIAAVRPLVAASAICFLNLSFISIIMPKTLAFHFGLIISPLIIYGIWLV